MKANRSVVSRLPARDAPLAWSLSSTCAIVRKPGNLSRLLRMLGIVVMIAALAPPAIAPAADAVFGENDTEVIRCLCHLRISHEGPH